VFFIVEDANKLKLRKELCMADNTDQRGFASMDEDKQREIASKGGKASGGNFKNDRAKASRAGKKGGSR
jgi:general stress protein YciG